MQFFTSTTGGNASKASWITGVGLIQLDTASLLEKFLSDNDAYGWRLILHSPGGSMVGGLRIGGVNSPCAYFNAFRPDEKSVRIMESPCQTIYDAVISGRCLSACAYAYLGGVARELNTEWVPLR